MQKTVLSGSSPETALASSEHWRNLEEIASVQVTSEDPLFPIEGAFRQGGPGWRASAPGKQTIRLQFAEPLSVRRIQIRFEEKDRERTQQFTLRWSAAAGQDIEIVRQQWNFSPSGSTVEVENLTVNLDGMIALELTIEPATAGSDAIATLASLRLL